MGVGLPVGTLHKNIMHIALNDSKQKEKKKAITALKILF